MRFDVVIIGGGLTGLAAGLALLGAGKSCALLNSGQSALHFSSGSFDFLNALPDGTPVENPARALEALAGMAPAHPYSMLGPERTLALAEEAEYLLQEWEVPMEGSVRSNHLRLTPLGLMAPCWLSAPDLMTALPDGRFPWKRVLLLNLEGFLDFYPEILASNLAAMGVETDCRYVTVPPLEVLRNNPSEFRSINIARVLDKPENLERLADQLSGFCQDFEAVLLPACLGQFSLGPVQELERRLARPVRLVPTLPPSLLGARVSRILTRRFVELGGNYMPGDKAVGYAVEDGRITRLFTENHEDIPLEADHYLLATGSFFSQGLKADQHAIRESVFALDLVEAPGDRARWSAPNFFDPQPYSGFGVRVDAAMRGFMGGRCVENLHAAGMVVGNFDAVRLGCGAGVALVTALAAVEAILDSRACG